MRKSELVELFHKVFEDECSAYALCIEVYEPADNGSGYMYGDHMLINNQEDLGKRMLELYNILSTTTSEITSIALYGTAKMDALNDLLRAFGPNAGQVKVKNGEAILVHRWEGE